MAIDRIVDWKETVPTREEVTQALLDYMGDFGGKITIRGQWTDVLLPGKPSDPFRKAHRDDDRWFEIFFSDDHISVITRDQDRLTNAIAYGFAVACAQHWQAEYSDGVVASASMMLNTNAPKKKP